MALEKEQALLWALVGGIQGVRMRVARESRKAKSQGTAANLDVWKEWERMCREAGS